MAVSNSQGQSRLWIVLAVILVVGIAGGGAYLLLGGFSLGSSLVPSRATPAGNASLGAAGQATATRAAVSTPGATLQPGQTGPLETGTVTTITAASTVNHAGPVAALQSRSVYWKTTGTVAEVLVQSGAHVQRGDVLMRLDPLTAPGSVIQAESDLLAAQTAVDELQHPSALSLANAKLAVAAAQNQLAKAEQDLRNAQNPAGQGPQDAVDRAKLALDTAQANSTLNAVSGDAQALAQATANVNITFSKYQHLQAVWDQGDHSDATYRALQTAQATYQAALDAQAQFQLRIKTATANGDQTVKDAQKAYDAAVNNLNAALRGPDSAKVNLAQLQADAAQAALADAQDKLAKMQAGGAPNDVEAAQARVQIAQAAVDQLELRAPIDGDVLAVSYQPGDDVSLSQSAVDLANRTAYHLNLAVNETEVSSLAPGNAASVTFASLPDLVMTGTVKTVGASGQLVQGVVQYTVQVEMPNSDPRVLLGMTANVIIITAAHAELAVPLDAIQRDSLGEFVNRVGPTGALERVAVISGAASGDLVLVQGNLHPGDEVQVITPKPTGSNPK